ncbi:hypothetical protein [Helicobacter sp. MIT 99-5507]|uniref:hypothetical protein n=1 Tax=Helicobacter sp. MIT 99-5507 TaxID=152489 RepID=UPI0015F18688|nr:hypothetical protein [Helicobacter sp. MIT 99-5507]
MIIKITDPRVAKREPSKDTKSPQAIVPKVVPIFAVLINNPLANAFAPLAGSKSIK